VQYEASAAKFSREDQKTQQPSLTIEPKSSPHFQQALFDRTTDFWLMGGASCIVWLAMSAFASFRGQYVFGHHYQNVVGFSGLMVLFINYPHFMLSYKIAYSRGLSFILKHWFQLLAVPAALVALIAISYVTFNDPTPLPVEINPHRVAIGEGLLGMIISLMFITVGWHYVKQTFGCMMVYSSFDRYKLNVWQRRILLGTLYLIWFGALAGANVAPITRSEFYGLPLYSFGLPVLVKIVLDVAIWIAIGVFAFTVPFYIWRKTARLPSLNFLIPLIALMIWWNPLFYHRDFYFLLVPLFHSLQYLPFAAKYEKNRMREKNPHWLLGQTTTILVLILTGFAAFEFFPGLGSELNGSTGPTRIFFFMAAAHAFINIHHYFIDNVIWRFHHPEVQKYLLGRNSPQAS
jgi:hypothetical protein